MQIGRHHRPAEAQLKPAAAASENGGRGGIRRLLEVFFQFPITPRPPPHYQSDSLHNKRTPKNQHFCVFVKHSDYAPDTNQLLTIYTFTTRSLHSTGTFFDRLLVVFRGVGVGSQPPSKTPCSVDGVSDGAVLETFRRNFPSRDHPPESSALVAHPLQSFISVRRV